MNNRNLSKLPAINTRSVRLRRAWKNKSDKEKKEYSELHKQIYVDKPELRKIRAESFRKVVKKYWKFVPEEKRKEHIRKMSLAMKKKWTDPESALEMKKRLSIVNGKFTIVKDLPRVNDYAGVVTFSEMKELNEKD
jgi:hypothetical protein